MAGGAGRRTVALGDRWVSVRGGECRTGDGATIASPILGLPEAPGHDRQFDYRYTWLRDASLLGQRDDAARYLRFVRSITAERGQGPGTAAAVEWHLGTA